MSQLMSIDTFLDSEEVLVDVRTPSEFLKAHIPKALNIPLLTDQERAEVGTLYRHKGKEKAVLKGLDLVGPKMSDIVRSFLEVAPKRTVRLYCWRGGQRSQSVAWLLEQAGFKAKILKDGYKSFRRWVLNHFEREYQFRVLGGYTGVGKSDLLQILENKGAQVLDLEKEAHHRGSAFGGIGLPKQPSTQHYENKLAMRLRAFDMRLPIWLEDESRLVGKCAVPEFLFQQISRAQLFVVCRTIEERIVRLCQLYGVEQKQSLIDACMRIKKRLGLEHTKKAISLIEAGLLDEATLIILKYYDKKYQYSIDKRVVSLYLNGSEMSDVQLAERLLNR
ncbi:MAG: tRNA 2-selenouridine(34) synthase MnmH [Proteobacteria bacterium]|nr:tRNA 2-selenouridine(34) synthase MnmH [Pseudomonadota bacterium]